MDGKICTGYIEAKDGASYRICYSWIHSKPQSSAIRIKTFVDGTKMGGRIYRQTASLQGSGEIKGVQVTESQISPLLFSKITLTADACAANMTEEFVKKFGTIEVQLSRIEAGAAGIFTAPARERFADQRVFEGVKVAAAASHLSTVGKPVESALIKSAKTKLLNVSEPFFLRFEFRYLSRELLEIKGLVPRLPSLHLPSPSLRVEVPPHRNESPPLRNIDEEIRKLEEENKRLLQKLRYQELEDENERLRQKLAEAKDTKVKRQATGGVRDSTKKIKLENGESGTEKKEEKVKLECLEID